MSEKTPAGTVVIVCATILAVAALVLYGVLAALGKVDTNTLPLVFAVLAIAGPILGQQWANNQRLKTVEHQTNGNTTRMLEMIERQGSIIAQSQPVALPESWTLPPATQRPGTPPAPPDDAE